MVTKIQIIISADSEKFYTFFILIGTLETLENFPDIFETHNKVVIFNI